MMKLTYQGIRERDAWEAAGIELPSYDPEEVAKRTKEAPVWLHFGCGNIFRIFIGGIADRMLAGGHVDKGIICAESFDCEIVDKIYRPYDNLVLGVTLHSDGRKDRRVLGSLCEAIKASDQEKEEWERLVEVFTAPSLQMVSFTITEKGYGLKNREGEFFAYVAEDMTNGPDRVTGAMGIVTALLYKRFQAGGTPIALVSMDNVSHNGEKLKEAILETAKHWTEAGKTEPGFLSYIEDEARVSFPWTMIDKITPRPSEMVRDMLETAGVEDMDILVTEKKTYIAPFANAEGPEYLVIEGAFPNGRPPLEEGGVYVTDRETVNKSERMKVTVCLNPIHTALCTYARMLGYELFADAMKDPELVELAKGVGYREGIPVVKDPEIISPIDFLDELMSDRFPNPYLGDTSARIAVDISQMVGIRFGETIKEYVALYGNASSLISIPLAIAGWIRYLLGVDDHGDAMERSPDPMLAELTDLLKEVRFGDADSVGDRLQPILSNERIFGVDLYKAGIGASIEDMVRDMLRGRGAVRETLKKYLVREGE